VRYVQLHGILEISAYGDFNCPPVVPSIWLRCNVYVHAPLYFFGRVIRDRKINTARRVAHSTKLYIVTPLEAKTTSDLCLPFVYAARYVCIQ
jgi:hypothetical protein